MGGMQGTRRMFTRIPGDVIILTFRGMCKTILGNFTRNRGMLSKIPGYNQEDSGESKI